MSHIEGRCQNRDTHLSKDRLVLLHFLLRQLDGGSLGGLFLLFLVLNNGLFAQTARFLVPRQAGLQHILDEVIGTEDVASLAVLHHPVGKPRYVAGCFEDRSRGHNSGVQLEHEFLDDEVLAPFRDDVGLQGRARGTVVVQTGDTWQKFGDLEAMDMEEQRIPP